MSYFEIKERGDGGVHGGYIEGRDLEEGVGFKASGAMDGAMNTVREEVSRSEEEDDLTCGPHMSVWVGGRHTV
jgi:hypothetical protein